MVLTIDINFRNKIWLINKNIANFGYSYKSINNNVFQAISTLLTYTYNKYL